MEPRTHREKAYAEPSALAGYLQGDAQVSLKKLLVKVLEKPQRLRSPNLSNHSRGVGKFSKRALGASQLWGSVGSAGGVLGRPLLEH